MSTAIYARRADLSLVGQIDDFQSLDVVARFNAPGTWVVKTKVNSLSADVLGPSGGILVIRNGKTLLSGPTVEITREWDGDNDSLTIAGVTDDIVLEDRLVLPCAPNGGGQYVAAVSDVQGPAAAETVMRHYVDANCGPGAVNPSRRVAGLTLATDLGRGANVSGAYRFDVLGDALRALAISGGDLGFRVIQVGAGLQFQVYVPADLSATAVFAEELGNLRAVSYRTTAPAANYVIAGGQGEGTARLFAESGDSTSIVRWGRRIERFRDRRDTADPVVVVQAVNEELAANGETSDLSITPIDTLAVQYLKDYTVGDVVRAVVDGTSIVDVLREVRLTLDPSGEVVAPKVGSAGLRDVLRLFDSLRTLSRRVAQLEKR